MLCFEDSEHVRRFVKAIIDRYEMGIRSHGSYQKSLEEAQDETVQSLENAAELVEYNSDVLH